jgi:hypothetical protein
LVERSLNISLDVPFSLDVFAGHDRGAGRRHGELHLRERNPFAIANSVLSLLLRSARSAANSNDTRLRMSALLRRVGGRASLTYRSFEPRSRDMDRDQLECSDFAGDA